MVKKLGVLTPRDKVQFTLVFLLLMFGGFLLTMGLFADPQGQIDRSVLVAYGEVATLAAGILGIDAVYTNKLQQIVADLKKDGKDNAEEQ